MTSILRQIIAGSRAKHPESNLDLCYVTPFLIATSGPRGNYPQRAYRNPLDQFVKFLDEKHGENWCIWEFRAEGTGYPDSEVHGRVRHYPWPDHHPPPFAIVPLVIGGMRKWLDEGKTPEVGAEITNSENDRVVVVHCRAGKGRSGTMACSYLITECGWKVEEALVRFTERRMRPGFGPGVSIPSQLRWIGYVDRWARGEKVYVDRQIEILEIHVWGLRDGVKVAVEGYIEEGKVIKTLHIFSKKERIVVEGNAPGGLGFVNMISDMVGYNEMKVPDDASNETSNLEGATKGKADKAKRRIALPKQAKSSEHLSQVTLEGAGEEAGGRAVVFKPSQPIFTPTSDINIDFERRNKAGYGLAMVTAVAHVWFNAFFEGNGPEQGGHADDTGLFEIDWDKMDGIKGSIRKGARALDRIAVLWRAYKPEGRGEDAITIHELGDETPIPQLSPANWEGGNEEAPGIDKVLGLRSESPTSANISKASSVKSFGGNGLEKPDTDNDSVEGVKTCGPTGNEDLNVDMKDSSSPIDNTREQDLPVNNQGLDTAPSTTPIRSAEI
jgi:protein-tyrosine phosphatase